MTDLPQMTARAEQSRRDFNGRLLTRYYDATLLFLLLDYGLDVNVRLSFLDQSPGWRAAYYAFCIGCAVVMHRFPATRIYVGAIEGLVTMVGLIFGMYLGYTLSGISDAGQMMQVIANYAISGFFAWVAWSRGLAALGIRE